jgi:hypothetical protein
MVILSWRGSDHWAQNNIYDYYPSFKFYKRIHVFCLDIYVNRVLMNSVLCSIQA